MWIKELVVKEQVVEELVVIIQLTRNARVMNISHNTCV